MKHKQIIMAGICSVLVIVVLFHSRNAAAPAPEPPAAKSQVPESQNIQVTVDTRDWKVTQENGVTFLYPEQLLGDYVHTAGNWPPQLALADGPFACSPDEGPGRAITVSKKLINGHTYCSMIQSDAAAGSIYTTYAYSFEHNGRVALLRFTVQRVQCENYDDPKKSECKTAQASFDPDALADAIASSAH